MVNETEKKLKIEVQRSGFHHYVAFFDIPGVSISGYGKSETEAKYNLLLRLLVTSISHMDKVLDRLEIDSSVLELRADYYSTEKGLEIVLRDKCGRKCITKNMYGKEIEILITKEKEKENE